MAMHSRVLWTFISVVWTCKWFAKELLFFLITHSVASSSEKVLNMRRDTVKVVALAALEAWVTRRTWRRQTPAVHVYRQLHQLHGSLSASSGGEHSRASLSALTARLQGEGPRQRQHPPRIQQCKRPLPLRTVSPYAALRHWKKRQNTLILYQTQTANEAQQLWLSLREAAGVGAVGLDALRCYSLLFMFTSIMIVYPSHLSHWLPSIRSLLQAIYQ